MISSIVRSAYCVCNNCSETFFVNLFFDSYIVEPVKIDETKIVNIQKQLNKHLEVTLHSLIKQTTPKLTVKDEDRIKLTFRE